VNSDDPFGADLPAGPVSEPVPGPVLSVVPEPAGPVLDDAPAGSEQVTVDTPAGSEPCTDLVLAAELPGREMTWAERQIAFFTGRARQIWQASRRKGGIAGMVHAYRAWEPETFTAYWDYVRSGKWRKDLPEGGSGKFVKGCGLIYHCTAGVGGKTAGKTIRKAAVALDQFGKVVDGTAERPLRAVGVLAVTVIAAVLIISFVL
jgi:hypothetical protein